MADAYLTLQDDAHLPTLEATAEAKRAAWEALRHDKMLAEPHISLAHAYFHEFNWPAAEREFKHGLDLNPNYAIGHFYFANYLLARGQFQEALAEARHAKALDPVSLPAHSNTATALYCSGQYDQATEQCLQVLEVDPSFARSYEDLGRIYLEKRNAAGSHKGVQESGDLFGSRLTVRCRTGLRIRYRRTKQRSAAAFQRTR